MAESVNCFTEQRVSCQFANELVAAVLRIATEKQVEVCTAVLDSSGRLRAFAAMDQVVLVAQEMCIEKARAALMGMETQALAEALSSHQAGMLNFATRADMSLMGGGVPIVVSGAIVGALGVGGASEEQDIAIAKLALQSAEKNDAGV